MPGWRPDPSFYPTPRHAMQAPPEGLAYVVLADPTGRSPDAIGVVDVRPGSRSAGRQIGQVDLPAPGDGLHEIGWNADSSFLCPHAPHGRSERRYLIAPGTGSSRIHIFDTKADPARPEPISVIAPDTLRRANGFHAPHAVHCGPDGLYVSALASAAGPGGICTLDPATLEVRGAWESEAGPPADACAVAQHIGYDTMVTSDWGTGAVVRDGLDPALLLAGRYGHRLHVWKVRRRIRRQTLDLGAGNQIVLGTCAAHSPARPWGFAAVLLSQDDLASSVWLWYRDGSNGRSTWNARRIITIPARPADALDLPPVLRDRGAVPPLVTGLQLSLDDRFLYIPCWGTGELLQYDVSDPWRPKQTGVVRIGGIAARTPHPSSPAPRNGGPRGVTISRDGRRIYVTNSLFSSWDAQFHPDGVRGWMIKCDAGPNGGIAIDPDFLIEPERGMRPRQIRLQGGDASDSFCFA